MPPFVSRRLSSVVLAVCAAAGGLAPTAAADPVPATTPTQDPSNSAKHTSQAIDLTFFRKTPCNADQILDAIQKVAPDQWALIKKEPNGSRKQKWVRNWLVMIIGSVGARPGILDVDEIDNLFGESFWKQITPYQDQIAEVCSGGDLRPADKTGPKGKKAPKFDPDYSSGPPATVH
ncbi:MAG: hypothetical protein ACRC20_06585 [Segniliparus sp.]|uniref:hypothetical protein n=1 Tax=Segniliparus sp. TaxID=2804064 RepID=UPI003F32F755